MNPCVVAITGASGAIYGVRLVEAVLDAGLEVELVVSVAGRRVLLEELGRKLTPEALAAWLGERAARVRLLPIADVGATIASGTYPVSGMAICPCTTGTAARIAAGLSDNLIQRAADVQLKEGRPLVAVLREAPLSVVHLENLLRLARAGAVVLPASPAFYTRPQSLDDAVGFVVERVLDALRIPGERRHRWEGGA